MSEIRVADISRWQGNINWDEFAKHIAGVVIKATGADGGLYTDGRFAGYRDAARQRNIPRWFYHFKGNQSARAQADYFVGVVGALQPGEALVLDDENEAKVNIDFAVEFANRVKELTGQTIIIYSNQARFNNLDLTPLRQLKIPAWVAKYGMNTGRIEDSGAPATIVGLPVVMWQYTSAARVPGVTENTVDMNIFYGTQQDFINLGSRGAQEQPNVPAPKPSTGNGLYTVVSGDTLSGIGGKVGVAWQDIANWNGIAAPYTIFPGQQLRVYGGSAGASVPAPTGTYTVVSGDTLSGIGAKLGINWLTIAEVNGIRSPYVIYPGQVLKVGPSAGSPVPTYTVRSGDNLSVIGQRVGVPWQRIAELNGIKPPYTIYPNQVLKLG